MNFQFFILLLASLSGLNAVCPDGYRESHTGACFKMLANKKSWFDAEKYCQSDNGHLASVHNAFDSTFLNDYANTLKCDSYYIGVTCVNGGCSWSDGSDYNFNNINRGTNTPTKEYGYQNMLTNKWNLDDGTDTLCFACNHPNVNFDCLDYKNAGMHSDGIYQITVNGSQYQVYCDMNTDGGGWTVIQRRLNGNEPFWNRKWAEYKAGFGNLASNGNYWAGNELIHLLTSKTNTTNLRIELHDDGTPDSPFANAYWYNIYDKFQVSGEDDLYRLHVSLDWRHINGNASTGWYDITFSTGAPFSTVDRINDPKQDCVTKYQMGGWWLYNCALSSLNGAYTPLDWSTGYGLFWIVDGNDRVIHPRRTQMMIRRSVA